MNILKDRAIWIVVVVIILAGGIYMVVIDPNRVDKMDNIVERDDERQGDVTEWSESYKRLEDKWDATRKHLNILRKEYDVHIKTYDSKVDSINNAFSNDLTK